MDRRRFWLQLLCMYAVMWLMFSFFFRPQPAPTAPPQQLYEAAIAAEEAAVNAPDTEVDIPARLRLYDQAIEKYRTARHASPTSDLGIQTYVAEYRVLNRMSTLQPTNTGYFDRQEHLLKEMEQKFKRRSARVAFELRGAPTEVPDVAAWAEARLNEVRARRDQVFQSGWKYRVLAFLVEMTGRVPGFSYWFALLVLTVALRLLLWPLNKKQLVSMQQMQRLAPQLKALQEELREKGRPPDEINREVFRFYRENNVNPLSGCLPAILQALILIPVFYMIREYEYQFTRGYFLWINPDLGSRFWWIGKNLAAFDVPLFLIYMASMVVYSLLQPKPADPDQARTQRMMMIMMPLIFGWMMWTFKWSSAFMFYWLLQNVFSMWQNWAVMRQAPAPAPAAAEPAPGDPLPPMNGGGAPRRRAGRSSGRLTRTSRRR